jgi:hypothetical protein
VRITQCVFCDFITIDSEISAKALLAEISSAHSDPDTSTRATTEPVPTSPNFAESAILTPGRREINKAPSFRGNQIQFSRSGLDFESAQKSRILRRIRSETRVIQ